MEFTLPEKFDEFADARKAGFLRVKQIKENGGKVAGVFCTFTPTEILDAAGFISVSLCGMSDETIPAAEAHLPKNLCPLIKSSYGFAVSDKCPYTYFSDLIVGETTCDGKKKMYELLDRIRPTYILHLPQGHDSDPVTTWTAELRRFIRYLEEKFDVTITDEMLRDAARKRNVEREARLKLMALQAQVPPPMSGLQMYRTMEGTGFMFTHEDRVQKMETPMPGPMQSGSWSPAAPSAACWARPFRPLRKTAAWWSAMRIAAALRLPIRWWMPRLRTSFGPLLSVICKSAALL